MEASQFSYGADQTGLVWGFIFDAGGIASPITSDSALQWLSNEESRNEEEFIWLHFNLNNTASEKWLRKHTDIVDEYYEALHEGSRSTRIEIADGALIAVINDILHSFSYEASEISTLWVNVTKQAVISARRKPLMSIERLRQAVKGGEEIRSSVALLIHLLRDQADVLVSIVKDSIKKVDEIEDSLLAGRLNRRRADLGMLRRVLVRLQRLLAPEPAAVFRLLQRPPKWIDQNDVQEFRQSTEEFAAVLNDMMSLQERIKLLQEEIAAQVNEGNNRSLYVLTIVTVLALPINICAGLFGMNIGGIPFAEQENGFWIVVSVVLTFTIFGAWMLIRRIKNK